jgi:hypothetical protein
MPNRWPTISGNWSNPAIWNDGLGVPTASDDVYANNQSVYIDTNITVLSLRNAASASAILGSGSFYLNNGVTVDLTAANAVATSALNIPLLIISGSNSARINGLLNIATSTGTYPVIVMSGSSNLILSGSFIAASSAGPATNASGSIVHNSSGSLIITGSVSTNGGTLAYGTAIAMFGEGSTYISGSLNAPGAQGVGIAKIAGSGSIFITTSVFPTSAGLGILKNSFGNIDIQGNIQPSSNAIQNNAPGTIRVVGNLFGGGLFFNSINNTAANALIIITGSVTGAANTAYGISNSGLNTTILISGSVLSSTGTAPGINLQSNPATLTIIGNVNGSSNAGGVGIQNSAATTITISGSVTAGPAASAIVSSGNGNLIVSGTITAGISVPAIQSSGVSSTCSLSGPFINVNNRNAVFATNLNILSGSFPTWTFGTETYGVTETLYTASIFAGYPSASNVRSGVVYGDTNQFTGVIVIPSASNVLKGIPVDNTVGLSSFDVNNAWDANINNLIITGSLGARLRNTSTVAIAGSAIASKGKL